ncbi:hypothetical protein BLNAU_3810 [Blattamonas nauphoetae]|uniref:Uncharacterized protein n=1 Tax=Blattamonas nauphoetae TaxID=2049346 RepID=A0ABQ9YCA3_9EUKA|nr:hypothetical protein BLNAU_3810 [Blattamonas nauphoetae]
MAFIPPTVLLTSDMNPDSEWTSENDHDDLDRTLKRLSQTSPDLIPSFKIERPSRSRRSRKKHRHHKLSHRQKQPTPPVEPGEERPTPYKKRDIRQEPEIDTILVTDTRPDEIDIAPPRELVGQYIESLLRSTNKNSPKIQTREDPNNAISQWIVPTPTKPPEKITGVVFPQRPLFRQKRTAESPQTPHSPHSIQIQFIPESPTVLTNSFRPFPPHSEWTDPMGTPQPLAKSNTQKSNTTRRTSHPKLSKEEERLRESEMVDRKRNMTRDIVRDRLKTRERITPHLISIAAPPMPIATSSFSPVKRHSHCEVQEVWDHSDEFSRPVSEMADDMDQSTESEDGVRATTPPNIRIGGVPVSSHLSRTINFDTTVGSWQHSPQFTPIVTPRPTSAVFDDRIRFPMKTVPSDNQGFTLPPIDMDTMASFQNDGNTDYSGASSRRMRSRSLQLRESIVSKQLLHDQALKQDLRRLRQSESHERGTSPIVTLKRSEPLRTGKHSQNYEVTRFIRSPNRLIGDVDDSWKIMRRTRRSHPKDTKNQTSRVYRRSRESEELSWNDYDRSREPSSARPRRPDTDTSRSQESDSLAAVFLTQPTLQDTTQRIIRDEGGRNQPIQLHGAETSDRGENSNPDNFEETRKYVPSQSKRRYLRMLSGKPPQIPVESDGEANEAKTPKGSVAYPVAVPPNSLPEDLTGAETLQTLFVTIKEEEELWRVMNGRKEKRKKIT